MSGRRITSTARNEHHTKGAAAAGACGRASFSVSTPGEHGDRGVHYAAGAVFMQADAGFAADRPGIKWAFRVSGQCHQAARGPRAQSRGRGPPRLKALGGAAMAIASVVAAIA
jgi:hypothetical protein